MDHLEIVFFLLQLATLLFLARLGGELLRKLGQPSVVGEILAGVILGPSILLHFFPQFKGSLVPDAGEQMLLIEAISLLGAIFLLLITGLEIDLPLIKRHARAALGVAVGGLPVSFAFGYLIGLNLPQELASESHPQYISALFIAVCIAVSAIPVLAKVLLELKMTRRNAAQTAMAAAMFEDVSAWILLSIVIGMASGTASGLESGVYAFLKVFGLLIITLTLGRWLINRLLQVLLDKTSISDTLLPFIFAMTLFWAALGQWLHIEAVLGAFAFGLLLSLSPKVNESTIHTLAELALKIFGPIFFAVAGLKVDLFEVFSGSNYYFFLLLLTAALICKPAGVYLGSRFIGLSRPMESLFFASGLACQGSTGIIIATIGLSLGILTQPVFSMLVLVAITTSLVTPTLMRWTALRLPMSKDEEDRLHKEQFAETAFLSSVHRVLLPLRFRKDSSIPVNSQIPYLLLSKLHKHSQVSVTLLTVVSDEDKELADTFLETVQKSFANLEIVKKVLISDSAPDAILDEAKKQYDLILVGATQKSREQSDVVFTPIVDYIFRFAPCPVILVQDKNERFDPQLLKGILMPTNGSTAARRAAEVAFALAQESVARVKIFNIVESQGSYQSRALLKRQLDYAKGIVQELAEIGKLFGVKTSSKITLGSEPDKAILNFIAANNIGILILGTNVHVGSERLHLGPRVERILSNAPCPVLIVNT